MNRTCKTLLTAICLAVATLCRLSTADAIPPQVGTESKSRVLGIPTDTRTYAAGPNGETTTVTIPIPFAPGATVSPSTEHEVFVVNVTNGRIGVTGDVAFIKSGSYEVHSSDSGFDMYTIVGAFGVINNETTVPAFTTYLDPYEKVSVGTQTISLGSYTPPPGYSQPGASSAICMPVTATTNGRFTGPSAGSTGSVTGTGATSRSTAYWQRP